MRDMSAVRAGFRCEACGATTPKWAGRCPSCGEWATLVEQPHVEHGPRSLRSIRAGTQLTGDATRAPVPLHAIAADACQPISTGVGELDRVLAGGLLPGSVTLFAGEPGIGKSTLLLQVLLHLSGAGMPSLLIGAEESAAQIRGRCERLGEPPHALHVLNETSLPEILDAIARLRPTLVVVDSIQMVFDPDVGSGAGSAAQVRSCAQAIADVAKAHDVACVLVGHVTKDGAIAGPRALEHLVDTVVSFEGDRHATLRVLRAMKHRFGPTDDVGLMEMASNGLTDVIDASAALLGDRLVGAPGCVVLGAMDGRRPLLVEVQGLVTLTYGAPRRAVQGLDPNRVATLVGVVTKLSPVILKDRDIYASVVGGLRVVEPDADVAVVLALASSATDRPVPADLVVFGEIGLAGEIRQVPHAARRLTEAVRHGFTRAVIPHLTPEVAVEGMTIARAATVEELLAMVLRWSPR